MGFVAAAELEGKLAGSGDEGDFAAGEDHTFIGGGDTNDLVVRDGDHRFLLEQDALVVEDQAAIGETDEAGPAAFAVQDGGELFAGDQIGLDAIELTFIVMVGFIRHFISLISFSL